MRAQRTGAQPGKLAQGSTVSKRQSLPGPNLVLIQQPCIAAPAAWRTSLTLSFLFPGLSQVTAASVLHTEAYQHLKASL